MELKKNIQIAPYTNFKVGGPADFFVEVKNADELKDALRFAKEKNVPVTVLGGGMNVLVADEGFQGLVVRIAMTSLAVDEDIIIADAGCTMGQVVVAAQKAGLTGLEWAMGLPGTVGGAVFGNAGCFGGETADVLENATVLQNIGISDFRFPISKQNLSNNFEIKNVDKNYFNFGYRYSKLKDTGEIVVSATFRLKKGSAEEIAASMELIRQKSVERIKEQPLGARTAGSTFKGVRLTDDLRQTTYDFEKGINRAGYLSAGWLLEQAGFKGYRVGGASFSSHHANFIINHGNAAASDILQLIGAAKRQVKEKFGIELEEEIRYIGFDISR